MSSSDSDADNMYYKKWSEVVHSKLSKSKRNLSLSLSRKRKLLPADTETQAGQDPKIPPVTPSLVGHLGPAENEAGADSKIPPVAPLLDHLDGSSHRSIKPTNTEIPPVTPSLVDHLGPAENETAPTKIPLVTPLLDHLQDSSTMITSIRTKISPVTESRSSSLDDMLDHSDVSEVSLAPSCTYIHTENMPPENEVGMVLSMSQGDPLPSYHDFDDTSSDDHDDNDTSSDEHDDSNNDENDVNEYFSFEDLADAIQALEIESITCYNIQKCRKGFNLNTDLQTYLSTINSVKDIKLLWQNIGRNDNTPIRFSGVPFVSLNKRSYTCHQGKDKNKKTNDRRTAKRHEENVVQKRVSDHRVTKSRKHIQPSKKLNCPAQFTVKKLLYFPQFEIKGDASDFRKKETCKKLRSALWKCKVTTNSSVSESMASEEDIDFISPNKKQKVEDNHDVLVKLVFATKFPRLSDHSFHHLGQAAGIIEKVDTRVVEYIKKLARQGLRSKKEILSRTAEFVNTEIFKGESISLELRRRFKPDKKTICNIVASVRAETRYSKFDQENVMEMKRKWETDANVKFIPKGSQPKLEELIEQLETDFNDFTDITWEVPDDVDNKLCLVYQSKNMQHLYKKYGPHLILLDATHKVCKYSLPLFFLVVQTNVNFQIAAIVVIEDESSELLIKALQFIKEWNPDVSPKYAMVDFDAGEILSLETIFPDIKVFLCDFHREQAWHRWVTNRDHNVSHIADDVKSRLRRIAKSGTVEDCNKAIADFRAWEYYTGELKNYFENTYFPQLARWCPA